MEHAAYWNDEAVERGKPYWIEDINDRRLLDFLQAGSNLLRCFEAGLAFADEKFNAVRGTVLDVGAGVCWTTALVSRWPQVTKVHALDFSSHRLFKIAPLVFEQFGAIGEKIERHCAPMAPLPFPDESADLVIFCQALYMNDRPDDVLGDTYRALRSGGVVLVTCESIEEPELWFRRWRRRAATLLGSRLGDRGRVVAGRLPDISGRYQYFGEDYAAFITSAGFTCVRQRLDYPLFKDSHVLTVNYFGVKEPRRAELR